MKSQKIQICLKIILLVTLLDELGVLAQIKDGAEYGNHWATYYEQPCCAAKRHVRHHKGKTINLFQCCLPIRLYTIINQTHKFCESSFDNSTFTMMYQTLQKYNIPCPEDLYVANL